MMNRKLINYLLIIVIFFIGISLGQPNKKEVVDVDEETEIVFDIEQLENNFIISVSKELESLFSGIFSLVFEIIGGGIKLIIGL